MKSRFRMLLAAITFFAGLALLFAALALPLRLAAQDKQGHNQHRHARYTVTVLGTLGGTSSSSMGLNNRGQVSGQAYTPGDTFFHAVLWTNRVITDLGTLGGPFSTTLSNPNARGEVPGYSSLTIPDPNGEDFCFFGGLECRGFLWQNGALTALPTLGGNNSLAYQMNNREQVVGVAENTTPDPTCPAFNFEAKPVIWQNDTVQELPTISGDPDGFGYGINDRGQIVGSTGTCNAQVPATSLHAVLWPNGPNGGVIDLGNLGGSMWNIAFYINNQGQVVGQAGVPNGVNFHAFLWQNGVMTDLGVLPGDVESWANMINNKNQAVGTSFGPAPAFNPRAFIWQNGVMTDLNTLIPAGSPILLEAFGINDRGQISGFDGQFLAYLLTPCDEEHANDEGCEEGGGANVVPQPIPAIRDVPSRGLPQSLLQGMSWHRFPGPAFGPKD